MTTCLILAAGAALRWHKPYPKQLVPVLYKDGVMPLIGRIVMQCNQAGLEPIIVTHRHELIGLSRTLPCRAHTPSNRQYITGTLLSTRSLWSERNIILLGDVYYSDSVFQHIMGGTAPLQFYGRDFEIYALVFLNYGKDTTLADLLVKHPGKLWQLYYALRGWSKPGHLIPRNDPIYWNVGDRSPNDVTRDIDLDHQVGELYAAIGYKPAIV